MGVRVKIFRITDQLSTSGSRQYMHAEKVNAWRMNQPFKVVLNNKMEWKGKTGDYLVKDTHGNLYPVAAEEFRATYDPIHFKWDEQETG